MPLVGNPLKCGTRDVIEVHCTLQGTGSGNAPTLDVGGAKLLFGTPTRSSPGKVTIPLNESVVAVKVMGATYTDTNYDSARSSRRMVVRSKDVKTAKTITLAIENDADGGANTAVDLDATQSFDFILALHYKLAEPS